MIIKLLISFLLFQLSLAQTSLQNPVECKNPRSKVCLLQVVTYAGFEVPKFPNLTEKHTLIIRSGNIPHFTENLTFQLGGVTKVTLGRLNIESLHIPSNWVSLNAESNQIRELIVEPTDDDPSDRLYGDGPADPIEEDNGVPGKENPTDSREGPKGVPNKENPTDSREGPEDVPSTENPANVKEGPKGVPNKENSTDSKEGPKDIPGNENPADVKEGPEDVPSTENPADAKGGPKDIPGNENPADDKEGPKGVPNKENPADSKEGPEGVPNKKNPANLIQEDKQVPNKKNPVEYNKDAKENSVEYRTDATITTEPDPTTTPVEPEIFAPIDPIVGYKIQSLNLANNKLQSIRELKCMVNLKELRLDGNELEFIEMATFDKMTKLRKLSLAKNKINHISSPKLMQLPSLEWFSLAFNRLDTLQISNWNMLQLVELDVSQNMLVKLDVDNFDQFASLEKLAMANNSWTCYWLNEALKEISKGDFITLVDRIDDPGHCPNGLPVEGICCSLTVHDDDESNNENLHERIERFQKEQDRMGNDLKGKIGSFGHQWNDQWETLNRDMAERRKRIEAREKEPKDDSKVTETDIMELNQLIDECKSLLDAMESLRKDNSLIAQSFTQSFYTTIALKNKLLEAMRSSSKLKNDLNQYEISFKADVN